MALDQPAQQAEVPVAEDIVGLEVMQEDIPQQPQLVVEPMEVE